MVDITESADGIMEKYYYVMHTEMKVGFLSFCIQPSIKAIHQETRRILRLTAVLKQNSYGKIVKEMNSLFT